MKPVAKCNCVVFQPLIRKSEIPLPPHSAIEEHFQQFGRVMTFHQNDTDPNGFVVFETIEEAQKALSTPEHVVNGYRLNLIAAKRDLSIPK